MPSRSLSTLRRDMAMKIPNELWTEIFKAATEYQGIDELELDPLEIPFDGHLPPSLPDAALQQKILNTRLSIIRVCRRWYDLGIRHLWSHLVIWRTASFVDSSLVPKMMIESCERKPNLAKYVKRLSIMSCEGWKPPATVDIGSTEDGLAFISALPNLVYMRVDIKFLSRLEKLQVLPKLRHMYTHSYSSGVPRYDTFYVPNPPVLKQVHSLHLQCRDLDLLFPFQAYPELRALRVQSLDTHSLRRITPTWNLSGLRHLSVRGGARVALGARTLPKGLYRTLESLEIIDSFKRRYTSLYSKPREIIELPRLHTLQVSLPPPIPFSNLKCPKLRVLGIHQPAPEPNETVGEALIKMIDAAMEHFTNLCDIQIHHNQIDGKVDVDQLLSSDTLPERYIEGWKERGTSITFTPPLLSANHPHNLLILTLQTRSGYRDSHIVYEFMQDSFSFINPNNCFARCGVKNRWTKWTDSCQYQEEASHKAALAMVAQLEAEPTTPPRIESPSH